MARAYQRAVVSGTQLRLVVRAPVVRRAMAIEGLDRLISIYPTLEAAIAAGTPDHPGRATSVNGHRQPAQPEDGRAAIAPAVLWRLIDALGDGVVLTDDDGTIVAVNRRLTQLFGYEQAELTGRPVDGLLPAGPARCASSLPGGLRAGAPGTGHGRAVAAGRVAP